MPRYHVTLEIEAADTAELSRKADTIHSATGYSVVKVRRDYDCDFCKDQPVKDANEWFVDGPLPSLPCPRCGKRYENYSD